MNSDPNRPKRPTSAYFFFVQIEREEAARRGEKITRVWIINSFGFTRIFIYYAFTHIFLIIHLVSLVYLYLFICFHSYIFNYSFVFHRIFLIIYLVLLLHFKVFIWFRSHIFSYSWDFTLIFLIIHLFSIVYFFNELLLLLT